MKIGVIGDGQLGRMLALSGYNLGFNFGFLGTKDSPSGNLGKIFDNIKDLDDFADVITYESENIDLNLVKKLKTKIYPPIDALKITQDRKLEKQLFKKLNIPYTKFLIATNKQELEQAIKIINTPLVIKSTKQGYDGKGQYVLKNNHNQDYLTMLKHKELIIEDFINFDFEVSIIASVNNKQIKYYQLTKNYHKNGMLHTSQIIDNPELFKQAKTYANKIIQEFNYVGVLVVEFFVKQNQLIANEVAPRVHNSGHWTMDGACTSQFENHIRAITNLELGKVKTIYNNVVMHNIITTLPDINKVLNDENTKIHLYNKTARKNRKLGHINIVYD